MCIIIQIVTIICNFAYRTKKNIVQKRVASKNSSICQVESNQVNSPDPTRIPNFLRLFRQNNLVCNTIDSEFFVGSGEELKSYF